MIFNAVVLAVNGQQEVHFVSGQTWATLFVPAFLQVVQSTDPSAPPADPTKYGIAEVDTIAGQWLQLTSPWPGPTGNVTVQIYSDYTPSLGLPLANPGDVNIADLWNRAMRILDQLTSVVPLHGPTHIGTGLDPVPLANQLASGALCQLSGLSTDYIGGDNQCHALAGVPTGSVILYCGKTLPLNWISCDGGQYGRTTYANLYAVLGGALSPWGQGDGKTTFNSPDLRGRVPMGVGTGKGLSLRALGQLLGEENHTTVINEMPAHVHSYVYDNWQSGGNGRLGFTDIGTYKLAQAEPFSTGSAGGGAPHNNIQPSTVVQFIIRT